MQEIQKLKWSDITSETLTPQEYLEKHTDKAIIKKNYESYQPNKLYVDGLQEKLEEKSEKLKVLVIGAKWCGDCSIQVPRFIKLHEYLKEGVELKILYGVKVDPFHKKGEKLWSARHSPPEAIDDKFDLQKIPTFYVFNKKGDLIGRIIERPTSGSLEKDIYQML